MLRDVAWRVGSRGGVAAGVLLSVGSAAAQELTAEELAEQTLVWDLEHLPTVARTVWHATLFNAGDADIRLNQLVIAGLLLLLGLWLAKRLARLVRHRLTRMQRVDPNAAAVIQRVVFYALAAIAVLVALPIAGIPITIFTVLGGAVAIGVGFGAQTFFANLISGVIIMVERPIRLGDIVQLADTEGRVEEIGNRCTRLRRFDGIDVLVPNGKILENEVINWTLFDDKIRGTVTIGVAYGSDARRVADLLQQATAEHPRVLKDPEPTVVFEDFGSDALMFVVYFWTNVSRPMDLKRVQSDVRFRIDKDFAEAGITIAYPQRDVHLDTLSPLRVQVTRDAAA
jgi:small-conductance mechanosensitive channel